MLEYTEGDLFLISDFIDDINELKAELKDQDFLNPALSIIIGLLTRMLNNEKIDNFENVISDGIDLIKRLLNAIHSKKRQIYKAG